MLRRVLALVLVLALLAPAVMAQDEEAAPQMGFWEECETPMGLPEAITIGGVFAQSGAASVYGISQSQAVDLALAEINESAYLGEGVTLEIIYADSAGDKEQAIGAMTKLVEEDGVVAVLGPTLSSEAFSADPIAQENGVPVMGVSNTAAGITDMGDFVFRDSLPESAVIPGTIEQATATLGLTQVAVLYGNDDDFTVSGYDVFVESLEANDVEILAEATFAKGDVDFSAQLTTLLGTNPEALVVSALAAEATQIIVQARQAGYTGPIIGGNGLNSPAVLTNSGEASEGVIVGAAWNIASPEALSATFTEAYSAAYEDAKPDQFAAQAYTGAWLMATAIRCGGSAESLAIRDALAEIVDFPSPLGLFSFDENRNPVHTPVVQIAQGGAFVVLGAEAMEE